MKKKIHSIVTFDMVVVECCCIYPRVLQMGMIFLITSCLGGHGQELQLLELLLHGGGQGQGHGGGQGVGHGHGQALSVC